MYSELLLDMLNKCDVRIDGNLVYIDEILIDDAVCEVVEHMSNNRSFRIVTYKGMYFRQNGYHIKNRAGHVKCIMGEQEWYAVKPQVKVMYEYS